MEGMMREQTRWVIVGAGFAGASGRNAALVKMSESDPVIRTLAVRSLRHMRSLESADMPILDRTGGLSVVSEEQHADHLWSVHKALDDAGVSSRMLTAADARAEFSFLRLFDVHTALWCEDEAVADIHALLTRYIEAARAAGFRLRTNTRVEELLVEAGTVVGVRTGSGEEIRADVVIDASGAWAGKLGRVSAPLPLRPLRRHLFVSAAVDQVQGDLPFTWLEDASLYFRREGDGLLLSPCDETPMAACMPPTDPAAAELLAEKLARVAPSLSDLAIRRQWACLRTFAHDRRPLIGPDPDVRGLFHVSGLGGFGMMCSAAIGELAADLLAGTSPDWIDPAAVSPDRLNISAG
jgi:D-arginine dehydrogenase